MKKPPATEPEPAYEVKIDGNDILNKKQDKVKVNLSILTNPTTKEKVEDYRCNVI